MNGYPFFSTPFPSCALFRDQSTEDLQTNSLHRSIRNSEAEGVSKVHFEETTSCKSDQTYPCYIKYLLSLYYRGYGQVRDLDLEEAFIGDPSLVIQAPGLTLSPTEMNRNFSQALKLLTEKGIRKRFMCIHFPSGIYIIGGYEYRLDPSRREHCKHDYLYQSEADQLLPIDPLPDGRVSFALCTDGRYIICAGGHTYSNVALKSVYMFDTIEQLWIRLPDLPAPTSAAGIALHQDTIHLLGGFDIIINRSVVHGEYVMLDLNRQDQGWIRRTEIDPGRARPLLLVVNDPENAQATAIYSAGGYEIDVWHQPHPIARLERYNERFERWEFLDVIPGLKLDHGLSYANNKLYVSAHNQYLQDYNFRTKQWKKKSEEEDHSKDD